MHATVSYFLQCQCRLYGNIITSLIIYTVQSSDIDHFQLFPHHPDMLSTSMVQNKSRLLVSSELKADQPGKCWSVKVAYTVCRTESPTVFMFIVQTINLTTSQNKYCTTKCKPKHVGGLICFCSICIHFVHDKSIFQNYFFVGTLCVCPPVEAAATVDLRYNRRGKELLPATD